MRGRRTSTWPGSGWSIVAPRLAAAIRRGRTSRGWSQDRLAGELKVLTGWALDPSAIARIETGDRDLSATEALAFARMLPAVRAELELLYSEVAA